ncbi:MAG: DUF1254 domain-containing protein [Alphaproteobacteria bacterium]|nr:DUF1254 domain-containing protein [Alphaproteobacteria bacterium]
MISRRAVIAGAMATSLARPTLGQSGLRVLGDLARRAAIYAAPIYETYRRRWRDTVDPDNPGLLTLNKLDHTTTPLVAEPDTLVSSAWLDLAREPMFLLVPDMGARSYDFAVVDMFGDTIDHVSRRLYGGRSPPHVLFGPSWSNPPPTGVRAIQATTNLVRLTGRISVHGAGDLEAALVVQAKVLLETPATRNERRVLETQELMPAGVAAPEELVAGWPELHPDDPWDLFVVAARTLGEGPVPDRDAALVAEFAALRLRPGRRFDLLGFSPLERAAMRDGIDAGQAEIRAAAARAIRQVGAWRYPPFHPGDFGEERLQRAVVAMVDPLMPEAAESMTLVATTDDAGAPLDSARRYRLDLRVDGPPATRSSWSLAAGGQLIGDLRPGGGVQIDLPHRDQPGPFSLSLHVIQPGAAVLDGSWHPPNIVPVD